MQEVKIAIAPGENFTAAGLMKRYADQTPGVEFRRSYWGETELWIDGTAYRHHHWSITAEDGVERVTLHLLDAGTYQSINSMCRTCTRCAVDCKGTTENVWTGCTGRAVK